MKSTWNTPNTTGIAFQATELALAHDGLVVVITPSVSMANVFKQEMESFLAGRPLDIFSFPDWETLPYDTLSPHQDIISERIATLSRLPACRKGLLLLPITTVLSYVAPVSYMAAHAFSFVLQAPCNPIRLRQQLEYYGYFSVSQVMQPGEYAILIKGIEVAKGEPHGIEASLTHRLTGRYH
jgi:transcription-repair coupling factor (superfamily II helicase)